jgi:hypothetical protein
MDDTLSPSAATAHRDGISLFEAATVVKAHASRQRIELNVDSAALRKMLEEWSDLDVTKPVELAFSVNGRPASSVRVALCYSGSSCCADRALEELEPS